MRDEGELLKVDGNPVRLQLTLRKVCFAVAPLSRQSCFAENLAAVVAPKFLTRPFHSPMIPKVPLVVNTESPF